MKKYLLLLLLILFPIKIYAISAESYIVMDASSNRILESKNVNEEKLIASTTKIMTALIVLENTNINNEVTISKEVLKSYGSNIYIEVGEKLTVKDLLYGLLLRSGNDAAIELSNYISSSEEDFTKLMNIKANDLGMNNTNFINSTGLENEEGKGNTSTSYDMAILMSYALKNKTFKEIINTKKYIVKSNYKTYEWYNKNKLLTTYKYMIGGKTGYTKKAKRTLVTASNKDNKTLIIVTLNDPNDFIDHKYLYETNFNKYNLYTILKKSNFNLESKYYDKLYIKEDINILLTKEEYNNIKIEYNLEEKSNYNNNDIVGKVIIKLNNKEISKKNIYASKNDELKQEFWQKLLNIFTKK